MEGRVDIIRRALSIRSVWARFGASPFRFEYAFADDRSLSEVHARGKETKRRFVYGVVFMEWRRVGGVIVVVVYGATIYGRIIFRIGHRRRRLQISCLAFDRVSRCVRGYTQSNYPFTGMKFSLMRFNCTSTIELLSELGTVSSLELRVEIQKVWKYRYVSSKNSRRNQWIS